MKLQVLGSNSAGNCYILTDKGGNSLIIELGVNFKEVQKALNYDLSKVAGAIVTHEHGDHSKAFKNAIDRIPIYATAGTFDGCKIDDSHYNANVLTYFEGCQVGDFWVLPFDVDHDVNEPCGFIIHHNESGYILFLTDTTYLKYNFEYTDFSTIMIEANYCEEILNKGGYEKFLRDRVVYNHMSLQNTCLTLDRMNLNNTQNIILIHLSDSNSEDALFENTVSKLTGKPTFIAKKGSEINIGKL